MNPSSTTLQDPRDAFRAAVLEVLGTAPEQIEPGEFMRFSTNGKPSDKSGWCKLFADGRGGVFGCYRDNIREQWSSVSTRQMSAEQRAEWARQVAQAAQEREQKQRAEWAENAGRLGRLWSRALPLSDGDPVTRYLRHRLQDDPPALPDCLRYHPRLPYWHEGRELGSFPAMLAAFLSPEGHMVALHRTWLTCDGRKADVPQPKKMSGAAGLLAGGCIRLAAPVRGVLGIAEGIETAFGAWLASGLPVVASYSAGALASWRWPARLRTLVIFADGEQAGQGAAEKLRERAHAGGLRVNVMTPSTAGADWCDVWANRGPDRRHLPGTFSQHWHAMPEGGAA